MIKLGFKKTKMFGLVGFIGLFVSLGLASTVNADETQSTDNIVTDNKVEVLTNGTDETVENAERGTINSDFGEEQGNTNTIPSVEVAEANPGTEVTASTVTENTDNTTVTNNSEQESHSETKITKNGSEITVENPEVVIDQSNGEGKYQEFTVEYRNIQFPDEMPINAGDKVTMTFPEEINFKTKYEFDVNNPEGAVVGRASTNPEDRTVTTVFNDYFETHPLNKQMSLKLDAQWTDKVESGKPVTVNFNGTLVTANIGKEQEIGKDELVAKWGSQDENDPTVINWTVRLNYARRVLNYVTIIDEMSENQKLVDNYFEINSIESLDPWVDKGSAMDLVKSISKSDHGFTIKMDRLDHMIYINYKTKLTNTVENSVNPTNKIELKAETDGAVSYSYVQLVGGKGNASGENKSEPTWEIPNDAPIYDKPSINIEDIPLLPPAPILEKPYLPIEDIPMMPPAPVLDKPEYPIPSKPEEPNTPPLIPSESPKVESKKEEVNVENKGSQETPVTTSQQNVLPSTGDNDSVATTLFGVTVVLSVLNIALNIMDLKKRPKVTNTK